MDYYKVLSEELNTMQQHQRPSCMQGETLRLQSARAAPEELGELYCSPNIVWVTKSRRMRRGGM